MKEISLVSTPAESQFHRAIKLFLYKYIYENDKSVAKRSLEKYFGNRYADIYFKFNTGKEVVVEVQNSKISVKEIIARTKDYNKKGIFVLWILYGDGKCVASYKKPEDAKSIKISPAENYLHRMYGGRVYYVNLDISRNRATLKTPFALHYSKPIKKKKQGLFKNRYDSYFIRDSNYITIPSWNLMCSDFAGFKIARFYDKNIKSLLKEKIVIFYKIEKNGKNNDKKFVREVIRSFKKKYGMYMIYNSIVELHLEKKIVLSRKMITKMKNKINL
jgi:competence CoiA-like predicted nuclease